MVGIVVVSHSSALADAAVDLAGQMAQGSIPIAVAAGSGADFGTDATRIAEAIERLDSPDGVLILVDLGSAVLNAEMALELAVPSGPYIVSSAPLVEGLVVAVVAASSGADLNTVAAECNRALAAKQQHLDGAGESDSAHDNAHRTAADGMAATNAPDAQADIRIANPDGLHARPAAALVQEAAAFHAVVTVTRPGYDPAPASSVTALASLDVHAGDTVTVAASGTDAHDAVDAVVRLAGAGFTRPEDAGPAANPSEDPVRTKTAGIGRAVFVETPRPPAAIASANPAEERSRLDTAAQTVGDSLTARAAAASGAIADILAADAAMARDPSLLSTARDRIDSAGADAPGAVWQAAMTMMEALRAGSMRERAADVAGVRDLLCAELSGITGPAVAQPDDRYVLVADDLAPVVTADLDPTRCAGIVMIHGGPGSHSLTIACQLGIPAVADATMPPGVDETTMLEVDADRGTVRIASPNNCESSG